MLWTGLRCGFPQGLAADFFCLTRLFTAYLTAHAGAVSQEPLGESAFSEHIESVALEVLCKMHKNIQGRSGLISRKRGAGIAIAKTLLIH